MKYIYIYNLHIYRSIYIFITFIYIKIVLTCCYSEFHAILQSSGNCYYKFSSVCWCYSLTVCWRVRLLVAHALKYSCSSVYGEIWNVTFLNAFISNTHARIRIVYNWYVAFCKWAFTWKICTLGLCLYVVNLINERSTVTVCAVQIL